MAATWSLRQLLATASKENMQGSDTEGAGSEVLQTGDFRIDTRRHTATLRGEPLELTGEEFDVLVFLTANPQRVVTPQTTLATHWSGAGTHQTQFLRVLLSLRKKLENAATGQQYLRTEPWIIYRFDPASSVAK
ncbi:MAG TPA: winged helix-turn-helix domain-containing protein [Terriglobales bacterium]|nr:winged helix-turn-helix domain-containing protein [Terriglobales bacterium]